MRIKALISSLLFVVALVACDSSQSAQASNAEPGSRRSQRVKKARAKKSEPQVKVLNDSLHQGTLPQGFVYVKDVIPDVIEELRYNTTNNFMGERADGYQANRAILTVEAAQALKGAADELRDKGYVIKIYDAYRPQSAVSHFVQWSKTADERNKADYYPTMSKRSLFGRYISRKSGHSRGSDMGGHFDFFGQASHTAFVGSYPLGQVTTSHRKMRLMLKDVMTRHGFKAISNEWWHFTLKREPHPTTYYNFPVK